MKNLTQIRIQRPKIDYNDALSIFQVNREVAENGVRFLESVNIVVYLKDQIKQNLQTLVYCHINVSPSLNPNYEEITLDTGDMLPWSASMNIRTNITKEGVEMVGYDNVENYLKILRSLVYMNRKARDDSVRLFRLSCSQLGEKFHGADFATTVTIGHTKDDEPEVAMDTDGLEEDTGDYEILIKGTQTNVASSGELKQGVKFLRNLKISAYNQKRQTLNACHVKFLPKLSKDKETVTLDHADSPAGIKTIFSEEGVELIGYAPIDSYAQLLRSLTYSTRKARESLNRVFKVICTQHGERLHSAEFLTSLVLGNAKAKGAAGTPLLNGDLLLADDQDRPEIVIKGNQNSMVTHADIKQGVRFLRNVNVAVYAKYQVKDPQQTLVSCNVNVFPYLNPDHEEITMGGGSALPATSNIRTNIIKQGVEMIGYDSVDNYLAIMHALVYINRQPAYYLNRVFNLSCSHLGEHQHSPEFILTLTLLSPKKSSGPVTAAPPKTFDVKAERQFQHPEQAAIPGTALKDHDVKIYVVVCGFFVLLIVGVGFARLINSSSAKNREKHQTYPKVSKR